MLRTCLFGDELECLLACCDSNHGENFIKSLGQVAGFPFGLPTKTFQSLIEIFPACKQ